MALPLLAVIMPAVVISVGAAIDGIANIQLIDKAVVNEEVVTPVLGASQDADNSMVLQSFQLVIGVIAVSLVIALIICC